MNGFLVYITIYAILVAANIYSGLTTNTSPAIYFAMAAGIFIIAVSHNTYFIINAISLNNNNMHKKYSTQPPRSNKKD